MPGTFTLAFEQIQLLTGLSSDQAVYLAMQLKAYNPATPDNPFYSESIGGLSPDDANTQDDQFRSGSGLYSTGLVQGAITRNDVYGKPRFQAGPFTLEDDDILEISILMAPEVFFSTVRVSPDALDRFLVSGFLTLVGASGFGVVGAAVGFVAGILGVGQGNEDVPVPCANAVIGTRTQWTGAEVGSFASTGLLQFGPKGPAPSYGCNEIDSLYWLSVEADYHFPALAPAVQGDCTLNYVLDVKDEPRFQGIWGDAGSARTDCVRVIVNPADNPGLWDIALQENGADGATVDFRNIPISFEIPKPVFLRNIYGHPGCPARSVKPTCSSCKRFTNVSTDLYLPEPLLGIGLRASHIGARPLLPIKIDTDHVLGCGPTGFVRREVPKAVQSAKHHETKTEMRAELPADRLKPKTDWIPDGSAIRLNPTTIAYKPSPSVVALSPRLSQNALQPAGSDSFTLAEALTLRLSAERALYLYAEFPAQGVPQCFRVRYLQKDGNGKTLTDVLLTQDVALVR